VALAVSGIGEPEECKGCKVLEATLEYERGQKEYFTKLLMVKSGIVVENPEQELDLESYPSIRHSTTLSTLRKMAITASRRQHEESDEAKKKFEESVSNSRK